MRPADKLVAALDSSRRRLTAEIEGLLEPRFSAKPARGWSVAQVIEHLSRVDENLARGIELTVGGGRPVRPQWADPLRRLIYVSGVYRVARIRTTPALDPPEAPARPEAMARSAATRAKLLAAIEANEGRGLWKARFRHPAFGPLSAAEMLDFVAYHEERHRLQIVRIKAALETPGAVAIAEEQNRRPRLRELAGRRAIYKEKDFIRLVKVAQVKVGDTGPEFELLAMTATGLESGGPEKFTARANWDYFRFGEFGASAAWAGWTLIYEAGLVEKIISVAADVKDKQALREAIESMPVPKSSW